MTRSEARAKYLELRSAGFNHDEAAQAIRTGQHEDPTAEYWDALIKQESGGRQSAVSPAGAVGIAQVMPGTGPEAAKLAGREWDEDAWRSDPEYNSAIGRAYLRAQMRRFGDPELGLAAYNAGPGRVQQMLEQGRSLPQETQNYVPAITGNSEQPMALTRDQARQYAQQRLAEGADMATIKAELQQQMGGQAPAPAPAAPQPAPAMAAQVQAPAPQVAPPQAAPAPAMPATTGVSGSWDQQAAPAGSQGRPNDIDERFLEFIKAQYAKDKGQPNADFGMGAALGLSSMVRGGRQLWNQLGNDEEDAQDLEYLKQREEAQRQYEQSINPDGSGMNTMDIGKVVPNLAFGAMRGPGIGVGALQGAAIPTVEGESRGFNAALGGALGGVFDVAGKGAKFAAMLRDRAKNAVTPRDALHSLTGQLGSKPGDDVISTYGAVAGKVKDKLAGLEDDFAKQYRAVEANPKLPPVTLLPAGRAGEDFELTDDVAKILTPRSQALLRKISAKGDKASPILDASGKPLPVDNKTTFEDVRTAIREIRSVARKLNRDDISRLQLKRAENMLDDDLQVWAGKGPEAKKTYLAARDLDKEYRNQVVPFYSNKTAVGKYLKSETLDEKALNSAFLGDETGMAVKDIQKRVPEITPELRKLYGSKLREARGDVPTIRKLESGTTGEALLTKPEREYLLKVAQEIYREGGPAQHSSVMPTGLLRLLEKTTYSGDINRMLGNLRPYGTPDFKGLKPGTENLIRYLRAGSTAELGE